jgi:hypothetical protein
MIEHEPIEPAEEPTIAPRRIIYSDGTVEERSALGTVWHYPASPARKPTLDDDHIWRRLPTITELLGRGG